MYPFILGYKESSILDTYFESYFLYLQDIVRSILPSEALSSHEFLFIPDIATTIEGMKNSMHISPVTKDFLLKEWNLFALGRRNELFSSQGSIIQGTDIRITCIDANPNNHDHNHPDQKKNGIGIGWGSISENVWKDLYTESFSLLHKVSPDFI